MKRIFLIIFISAFFISCSNDDDVVVPPLLGSWELMSVENEAVYGKPEGEEIVITFEETEYTGKTAVNEFGGDYEVVGNKLLLTNSFTTEIEDTEWANLFYEGIRNAYLEEQERSEFLYDLQGNQLTLRSDEELMTFSRYE